jgi:DNA-binding transcriptional MerR regulator
VNGELTGRGLRIGEMARASGLTVSALRFYDGAGVLIPAAVDPATGYRLYETDQVAAAQLLAGLRRVRMPVAGIAAVLASLSAPDHGRHAVRRALDDHLRLLEDGLETARREIARLHALVGGVSAEDTRIVLDGTALAAALRSVEFAIGSGTAVPSVQGVLLDVADGEVRLVATDRYRLAVSRARTATVDGPDAVAPLPGALVDGARALLGSEPVELTMTAGRVTLAVGGIELAGTVAAAPFPDWRSRLRRRAVRAVTVDAARLRQDLVRARRDPNASRSGIGGHDVVVLGLGADGRPAFATSRDDAGSWRTGVDREFLLQALDAGGPGQLVLELDGPLDPIAIRSAVSDDFSVLMPVRLGS